MIKWLEELRGENEKGSVSHPSNNGATTDVYSLVEIQNGKLSLMNNETGDLYEDVPVPEVILETKSFQHWKRVRMLYL